MYVFIFAYIAMVAVCAFSFNSSLSSNYVCWSLVTLNICRGGSKLIDGCAISAAEAVVCSSTVTSSGKLPDSQKRDGGKEDLLLQDAVLHQG
ncbi:hypothetical protein PILCRDRAFT_822836 [Piloderma croceum F 1598]|uniref:Secreted protein n=1 Tax=Piloderma croceum (strain F 1598) TaxID=765440 RepID=A0A0C3BRP1_PILCF|nr:hypothetical protein PILCRDRAFT_822836 [Piloderma croceum F 1598]